MPSSSVSVAAARRRSGPPWRRSCASCGSGSRSASMAELETHALGTRAKAMIDALAAITAEPGRITRLYLTPEHRRAADLVARWMAEAGLSVREDGLGTVRGRLPA